MRRAILPAVFAVLLPAPLLAHPSVSVVMDGRGNVFYSDLARVWRISSDGRKSVAVESVHAHELFLDERGNLYGEHLWYEGEKTNRWGHRVWRRSPDGAVTDVYPARSGFRTDYSFVRDAAGSMYWVEREKPPTLFRKRAVGGAVATLAACPRCADVRWMTAAPDGTLEFVDGRDLYEISPTGTIRVRARGLGRATVFRPQAGGRHVVMGLWTDAARNVYAAVYGTGEVKRIAPDGHVIVVARSPFPWSPTGGMSASDGSLWILEYSITNAVRVRRIDRNGRVTVF
jgi:streptogramin lyase